MYEPELRGICGFADRVIVRTSDGFAFGRFEGNTRPESESFEIHVIDMMTDEVTDVSYFHKEDIYQNTEENVELFRQS